MTKTLTAETILALSANKLKYYIENIYSTFFSNMYSTGEYVIFILLVLLRENRLFESCLFSLFFPAYPIYC